ncbi:hypothetical protein A4G19_03635 [Pasteurellaceae bacterium Macca]|nr:hypothetical protein [Pasteurellaceae bacterium Macca]
MYFRFFKGDLTQEPLKSLEANWRELREERDKLLQVIFNDIPFNDGWVGSEESIFGIVVNADNPELETLKTIKGYKIEPYKERFKITADKRYKAGKVLDKMIKAIREILHKHPSFSRYAIKQLGLDCWIFTNEGRAFFSVCGVENSVFLVEIPQKEQGDKGDEFPQIPDYLTEIKESEFLALQGK